MCEKKIQQIFRRYKIIFLNHKKNFLQLKKKYWHRNFLIFLKMKY